MCYPQSTQAAQKAYTSPNRPNPGPMNPRRCFKCQVLCHIAADCLNRKVITVADYHISDELAEEEKEEDVESDVKEEQEEVIKDADEGEMSVLRRASSSQRSEKEEQTEK